MSLLPSCYLFSFLSSLRFSSSIVISSTLSTFPLTDTRLLLLIPTSISSLISMSYFSTSYFSISFHLTCLACFLLPLDLRLMFLLSSPHPRVSPPPPPSSPLSLVKYSSLWNLSYFPCLTSTHFPLILLLLPVPLPFVPSTFYFPHSIFFLHSIFPGSIVVILFVGLYDSHFSLSSVSPLHLFRLPSLTSLSSAIHPSVLLYLPAFMIFPPLFIRLPPSLPASLPPRPSFLSNLISL